MPDQPLRPSPILARLLAAVFDFSAIMIIVLVIEQIWTTERNGETVPTTASNWLAIVVFTAFFVVPHATTGSTLGKKLCRLVLVKTDDTPASWPGAIVRFVVAFAAFGLGPLIADRPEKDALYQLMAIAQVAIPIAVYAPIIVRSDRRGLHDLAAGTCVRSTLPPLSDIVERTASGRS